MKPILLMVLSIANTVQADQKLEVLEVKQSESPAWGTNSAVITIKNSDTQSQDVLINWQSSSLLMGRGWGMDSSESISAQETRKIPIEYIIPAFPGKVTLTIRVRSSIDKAFIWERKAEYAFPFVNSNANPLQVPERLQKLLKLKAGYPRLRARDSGHFAIYFLEGDSYVEGRIDVIAKEREQIYRELREKINPTFDEKVALYLFPDADSKYAYTMHKGQGMAHGCVLVEIYNEKEHIDPYHEPTHIIAGSIGDPPAMFNEGLAVWSQRGHRFHDALADSWSKAFAQHGMLWPIVSLFAFHEIGSDESRPDIAYPESASLVNYLIGRYGFEKFLTMYRTLRNAADPATNAAQFEGIFGVSLPEVEKAWLATLSDVTIEAIPDELVAEVQTKYSKQ